MEKLSGIELELDIWFGIRNQYLIELPRLETEIESLTNKLYVNWLKSFNGYFSSKESDVTDYERSYLSDSDESFAADDDDDEDLNDLVLRTWLKFVEKDPVTSVTVRNQFLTESSVTALIDCPSSLTNTRKFLSIEVDRLTQQITSATAMRSLTEGSESEIKFAIENDMMMFQLSRDFGISLTDVAELEILQSQLIFEAPVAKDFHRPLPLAYQLTQRVIELLEDEIQRQQKSPRSGTSTPRSGSSTPRSRFYYEELNKSIEDAIKEVIDENEESGSSYQVLDILKENNNVVIDDHVKRTVRQKFFEATFARNSKPPAPEE